MRSAFSSTLKAQADRKTDNHPAALAAKVEIRSRVLGHVGAKQASIFDAFAGEGQIYRKIWRYAANYVGCDLKWYRDERLMYVADNLRVMRAIDLLGFTIFDFDAWGSPWTQIAVLCARRRVEEGELIGVVLTEGSGLKVKLGQLPTSLSIMAGLSPHLRGAAKQFDAVINKAIGGMCSRLNCRVIKRWEARGKVGSAMRYIGLVLEGQKQQP